MSIILHVDDHATDRRLMRFVLEHNGHTVVAVSNGQQALAQLAITTIDLVITDIVMPTMDGLMLARELRRDLRYKHLPIIFLTASSIDQDDGQIGDVVVDVVLSKPIDSDEILAEVDRLIACVRDKAYLDTTPLLEKSVA